jgi:hypothetical protein
MPAFAARPIAAPMNGFLRKTGSPGPFFHSFPDAQQKGTLRQKKCAFMHDGLWTGRAGS